MPDNARLVGCAARTIVSELGLGLEDKNGRSGDPADNPVVRKTANKLVELSEALPGTYVWVSVDGADVWLNFQSADMEINNGVLVGTVGDETGLLLMKLRFAIDSAIVGVMAQKHENETKNERNLNGHEDILHAEVDR